MMVARTAIDGVFALEGNSTNLDTDKLDTVPTDGWIPKAKQYKGKVYITSLEVNAPNGDNATFTVEFTGTGALTAVTGE
jgi:predicted secreted protein